MKVRILPPEEWSKLEAYCPQVATSLKPEACDVLVAEDENGIAACVSVAKITHFESLWVREDARKNLGVKRALMREAFRLARSLGTWALCSAEESCVWTYWRRMGARPSPLTFLVMSTEQERVLRG